MFDRHQVEITVMQFRGHSLRCISLWVYHGLLPCPISSAKSAYAISFDYWPLECVTSFRRITLEWHVWPGRWSIHNIKIRNNVQGAHNKFPDFFFVWALLLIVHTWNSRPLQSNLLRLQSTCWKVPTTSGRPHGSKKKRDHQKFCGWVCCVWRSWVWESQHASPGNYVSWCLGHSSRSSFHRRSQEQEQRDLNWSARPSPCSHDNVFLSDLLGAPLGQTSSKSSASSVPCE